MPQENFSTSYALLFSVKVLHRYFLNFSDKPFDAAWLSAEEKKTIGIIGKTYDMGQFWKIVPGEATRQRLRNLQMIYRSRADGFCIAVATEGNRPLVPLPEELELFFCVYPTDTYFLIYTDIAKAVMDELMKNDQLFLLTNKVTLPDPGANILNANETIKAADLIKRQEVPASEITNSRPLGLIKIRHTLAAGVTLLSRGGEVQPTLAFNLPLKNRITVWEYKDISLGLKPLVQHGYVPVTVSGKELANPTPATTLYKDHKFYSVIY